MGARVFAIGDVHGCATELRELLKKMNPSSGDTVVFLGDYIDRGPDSRGVVQQILDLKERCQVIALKGNHEAMFIDFLETPESAGAGLFILNGGAATIASYAGEGGSFELPEAHLQFFYSLKLAYETDTHFFVHAGVPIRPLSSIDSDADEMTLLWSRQPFLSSEFAWEKVVVHGHTPVELPEVKANRINVDTGCVFDGKLTAIDLSTGKFIQVTKGIKGDAYRVPKDPGGLRIAVRYQGALPVVASRPGSKAFEFETLNYNQFGVLMRERTPRTDPIFLEGDVIEGRIGPDRGQSSILFRGDVVRVESRNGMRLYGIKIDRVTNGNEGREWITRAEAMPQDPSES